MKNMISSFDQLFTSESIEDIILSPTKKLYFENGKWKEWTGPIPPRFHPTELAHIIAEKAQLQLGLSQPSADAYWSPSAELNFRAHVVVYPMVEDGPEITLRRLRGTRVFNIDAFETNTKIKNKLVTYCREGRNILVSGATGSGKSSLMCCLLKQLPENERIVILEDSPELPLPNAFSSKLLARSNRFGLRQGATWELPHLVYESLRMRPDRIVLGECRGPEALALLRVLQTGHRGAMTSIHAASAREALERFANLAAAECSDGNRNPEKLWDVVVHLSTTKCGKKEINELHETH